MIALYEISKRKQGGVTRGDLSHHLGIKEYSKRVFENRKFLEKYVEIISGEKNRETLYFIKLEVVSLMYYFRDYYINKKD